MKGTMYLALLMILSCTLNEAMAADPPMLRLERSSVRFTSNAPLEVIRAATTEMTGLIDTRSGSFAFRIPMRSFQGFNNPLQKEHFHENYMESDKYKFATFQGRIIEDVDFNSPGKVEVRSKGRLNIHGVEQERIINAVIDISASGVVVTSEFAVPLADHDISIPKIVEQKIAREISIILEATFQPDEAP
jgi:polyisoprenoid-binding protein YceI